ncbi:helix-turn-helix transcriptional regulator [Streptomyces sp. NPDC090077]|uniref:helix-turn-helix transcriptional regulator n=1 Tax=Streptomyces sp. NPDC090077 TaxID=3365938 RepID=UPI0038094015
MDIGELIRELRTAHGWSQGRLADEINAAHGTTLTREYVARWERGKVTPAASTSRRCRGRWMCR